MRAQILQSPASVATLPLVESTLPDPAPGPGELLLRVKACAICRTDLQLAEGEIAPRKLPVVPGHQVVGVVQALGEGVTGWEMGDRAGFAWLAGACGECRHCLAGNENLCEKARFHGWDRDGGYADLMTGRADFALPVPDAFDDVAAAPLFCAGIIGFRSLRRSGIQPGGRLGLYGYGSSARLAIQVARHWGCDVYVATRSRSEQNRALDDGAAWAGGYEETPPVPLDAAITFAPAGSVVVEALRALDRGGALAINAIHLDRVPEFPYEDLWWERSIRSVANFTRQDAIDFLRLAAEIPVRARTEALSLGESNQALSRLKQGEVSGTLVLVPESH
jgi:propanol-preferring alcohol dehydrogenase